RQCRAYRRRAGAQVGNRSQERGLRTRNSAVQEDGGKGRKTMEAIAFNNDVTGGDAAAGVTQNVLQLIAFSIGEQTYGVEITTVREIRAWNGATPLPNTREFVRGVINLRGTIVPIFDLRARFGEGQTSP